MLTHRVGFGLIEVLIVISILGIAAALTIPAFLGNPKQADPATITPGSVAGQVNDSATGADESATSEDSNGTK